MNEQILIVEDDQKNCELFSNILRLSGYKTDMAFDGEAALRKLDKNHYDLVISDIFMPKLNGLDLLKKIKEKLPKEKVIMITGSHDKKLKELSLKGGAITFLEKPFESSELLDAVNNVFEQQGFDGKVSEICLFDLVQFLTLAKKTKLLDIRFGDHHGQIYINNGEVVHAVTKTQYGEKAFYECLSWSTGSFKDYEYREPKRLTIQKPIDYLLMEAAKKLDEDSPPKQTSEPTENTPTQTNRLRPLLQKLIKTDGIIALAWLKTKGAFLMGEGPEIELLKAIPQFILSTEPHLKKFHDFPHIATFCLHSDDGRRILTIKLKNLCLAILIKSGYEAETIQDAIFRHLRIRR